jgi:hypothetical protein
MVAVVGSSNFGWRSGFIASWVPPGAKEASGDHLQVAYFLWLWQRWITHPLQLPLHDLFQFGALGHTAYQPFGWPLVLVSVPVGLLFGPVAAYNAVVVAAFVVGGLAAYALARVLGCSRPACAVAGFAFSFAPVRLVQGTSHINALLAPLMPLMLLSFELARRGRRWAAWATAACLISAIASGELLLGVYATGLLIGWCLIRIPGAGRAVRRSLLIPGAAAVAGGAVIVALLEHFVLRPSIAAGGRSAAAAAALAPRVGDLVRMRPTANGERFFSFGWPAVALAAVGSGWALWTGRQRWFAAGLLVILAGCIFLAMGPGLVGHPGVQQLARALPFFRYIRTPGRVYVVVATIVAVFAAWGVDAVPGSTFRVAVAGLAMVAIIVTAPSTLYARNPLPVRLPMVPSSAVLLHLPAFDPGDGAGAAYSFSIAQRPTALPNGYSPFATPAQAAALDDLETLVNTQPDPCRWSALTARFHIQYVAVHRDLIDQEPLEFPIRGAALTAALDGLRGLARVGDVGDVAVYRVEPGRFACPGPA